MTDVACSLAVPVNRLEADTASVVAAGHPADTLTESNLMLQMQALTITRHDIQEFYPKEMTLPFQYLNGSGSIRVDCWPFLRPGAQADADSNPARNVNISTRNTKQH